MSILDQIEKLALQVAKDALDGDISEEAEGRREALKILNPHYTILLKQKAKSGDDGDEESFDRFKDVIKEASSASTPVRGGSRRPS